MIHRSFVHAGLRTDSKLLAHRPSALLNLANMVHVSTT